jgi:hypothetical protein
MVVNEIAREGVEWMRRAQNKALLRAINIRASDVNDR